MTAAVRIPVLQGSPEWIAARRDLVTATDIGALLGIDPWRCEADVADEKRGTAAPVESNVAMRIGLALEPLIAREYEAATGRKLRRVHGLWRHPSVEWAAASPDFTVVGEPRLVEAKWSNSRSRWSDGLPEVYEAQANWQCFVGGYPECHVAALVGDALRIFTVRRDEELIRHLVAIASDFRRRLAEGGPFEQSNDSVRRHYPADNGAEMVADEQMAAQVRLLLDLRGQRKSIQETEEALEAAIKSRLGEIATAVGPGFRVSWKKAKDSEAVDWERLAESLLPALKTDRAAVVGPFVTVRQGARYFRVTTEKEDAS